jgi:hypothetical protein
VSHNGEVLQLPARGTGNKTIEMTATVKKNQAQTSKSYNFCLSEDEGYRAYLFAYFTGNSGNEEAIRFAVSRNGYNFNALNRNSPVIGSDSISQMNAVRDPHILRGETDSVFYMVVTDMKSANGWSSNHGIVMLKSYDLIHWTHSAVDIAARFSQFSTINRAWAPQTIFDPAQQRYMVYWSMRSGNDRDVVYYACANADFTDLVTTPQVLFSFPTSTIDSDIVFKDGEYHLFFKTEGSGNGIKKLVSTSLTSGYQLYDHYLQQTAEAVEGSGVFKISNSKNYILMYDLYTSGKYQFTVSSDLYNFQVIDTEVTMDFHPRHGAIIPVTESEYQALRQQWGQYLDTEPKSKAPETPVIYPNPASDIITVENRRGSSLTITDISGKTVLGATVQSDKQTLNISKLAKGYYIAVFSNTGGKQCFKFVKK